MKRLFLTLLIFIGLLSTVSGQTSELAEEAAGQLPPTESTEAIQKWLSSNKERVDASLWGALTAKGMGYFDSDRYEQALGCQQAALQVAALLHDEVRRGESLHQVGRIHVARGDLTSGLNQYIEAEKLLSEETGKGRSYLAYLLNDIAVVYRMKRETERGKQYAWRGLKLSESLGDRRAIGLSHFVLGSLYLVLEEHSSAISELEVGEKILTELNDEKLLIDVTLALGDAHVVRGEYDKSFLQYRKTEILIRKLNQPSRMARLYRNLARLHGAHGDDETMGDYLRQSLRLARTVGDQVLVTAGLLDLGMAAIYSGDNKSAETHLSEGLKLAEASSLDRPIVLALVGLGMINTETGNYDAAQHYYGRALERANSKKDKVRTAAIYWGLAKLSLKKGIYDDAVKLAEQAAGIALELPVPDLQAFALTVQGEAYLRLREFDRARKALHKAVDVFEAERAKVKGGANAGSDFLKSRATAYQLLVALDMAEGQPMSALLASERVKGRALLDALTRGREDAHQLMNAEERSESERLGTETAELNSRLFSAEQSGADGKGVTELRDKLTEARLKYDNFHNGIRAREQQAKDAAAGETSIITVDQIGDLINGGNEAVMVYSITPQALYLFVITRLTGNASKGNDGKDRAFSVESYSIPVSAKRLTELATDFRKRLARRNLDFRGGAHDLYDLLIKPAAAQLADKSLVCIVPDGPLWDLPFQALLDEKSNYLIERTAIYLAPSLSVLAQIRRQEKHSKRQNKTERKSLLAIGNPVPNASSTTTKAAVTTAKAPPLPAYRASVKESMASGASGGRRSVRASSRLPAAEAEVRAIGKLYPGDRSRVVTGAGATERVIKRDGGRYGVLHFATHAVLDDRQPLYSYLIMSHVTGEDGLLEAWEIMNLDLSADLVVISACNTARGKSMPGEGVIGMSWAFFAAGVPTTVVSQWEVDSASTIQLMTEFHRQLTRPDQQKGEAPSRAGALRTAAIKLLRQSKYEEPYFWAAFVVVGAGN